jgi:uncharacterized membrane protein YcaP (DUF421 family)
MDLVARAVIIYVLVFVFTRVLGRREMSSLQPFDLILLVVIGDLVQAGVTQNDLSVTGDFIVIPPSVSCYLLSQLPVPPGPAHLARGTDRAGRKRPAH